jgi:uncharacterized membrane protein YgaE (UPF0421/DUF939 family)
MHWSAYEVFSVISGVILVGAAFVPRLKGSERFWSLVIGAGLIAYAIYVANQSSGTFGFPVIIFVLPFLAVGYLVLQAFTRTPEDAQEDTAPRDS